MALAPKVTVSNVWHFPLLLVQKNTPRGLLKETAVVRVKAPPEVKGRAPIYLVVLIDVSRSKVWEAVPPAKKPSRLDLLKNAIKFIITQLCDGDHLTIVFNDKSATENFNISDGAREYAENKVHDLLDKAGDTAFKPALQNAVKILDGQADQTHLGFIILLSDGLDKSKFTLSLASESPVKGLLGKYPIHTFGLCKAHDPEALLFIAKESNGTYSSITENLSSKIIEALAVCLGGLMNVVAVDTVVKISASRPDRWKPKITKIDSGAFKNSGIDNNGNSCDITIGILYAGEVKDLIVHFEVNIPTLDQGNHEHKPLIASGEYKDIPSRQSIQIDERSEAFSVYARLFMPPDERPLLRFPMVLQQIVRVKVLNWVADFQNEYQGLKKMADFKKMNSRDAINKAHEVVVVDKIAGNKLAEMWKDFKEKDNSWKEAQSVGLNLERVENDIDAMVSSLKRGLGVGCVYSWVSSHQMQRATTTGLPTTAFLTPKMKEMVQEQSAEDVTTSSVPCPAPPGEGCMCKRAIELLERMDKRLERMDKRLERMDKLDRGEQPRPPLGSPMHSEAQTRQAAGNLEQPDRGRAKPTEATQKQS